MFRPNHLIELFIISFGLEPYEKSWYEQRKFGNLWSKEGSLIFPPKKFQESNRNKKMKLGNYCRNSRSGEQNGTVKWLGKWCPVGYTEKLVSFPHKYVYMNLILMSLYGFRIRVNLNSIYERFLRNRSKHFSFSELITWFSLCLNNTTTMGYQSF